MAKRVVETLVHHTSKKYFAAAARLDSRMLNHKKLVAISIAR